MKNARVVVTDQAMSADRACQSLCCRLDPSASSARDRTFGQTLSAVLTKIGLSQHRLAQLSGLGTDTVSRLANDVRPPTEAQALRIGGALLLDENELRFLNRLLEAADLYPLPIPGQGVALDEDYRPNRRGGWKRLRVVAGENGDSP